MFFENVVLKLNVRCGKTCLNATLEPDDVPVEAEVITGEGMVIFGVGAGKKVDGGLLVVDILEDCDESQGYCAKKNGIHIIPHTKQQISNINKIKM